MEEMRKNNSRLSDGMGGRESESGGASFLVCKKLIEVAVKLRLGVKEQDVWNRVGG